MNKLALKIIKVAPSVGHNYTHAVVLGEIKGKRRLPIVIGFAEAQAITVILDKMTTPRPLTHDLIKNILNTFDIHLKEVLISNLVEGVFYSQLICEKDGEEYIIDSRTSDALAIAIRCKCPIYIYGHIMDSAGIEIMGEEDYDENDEMVFVSSNESEEESSDYSIYNTYELETMLKEALDNEDYEKAARIRDEIKKRSKN